MFEDFSLLIPSMYRMGCFIAVLLFPFILVELKTMSAASAYKSCNYATAFSKELINIVQT